MKYLDANIFMRYLADPVSAEDVRTHRDCREFFRAVADGQFQATTSEVVLHEVLYVLCASSHYGLTNSEAVARLRAPVTLRNFYMPNKALLLDALAIFAAHEFLDFSDAWSIVLTKHDRHDIITYDRGFDKVPGVTRSEP